MPGPADPTPMTGTAAADALERRAQRYVEIELTPEFQELKSKHRQFVFPVTLGALGFYFAYVLTAAYAPDVMAEPVFGKVNVGIIFGLLQFVMTFAVTYFYVRYAQKVLDPRGAAIKEKLEREEVA